MAKQPDIETILVGYSEKHKLNKNFKAIVEKFDESLSRDTTTDTPNFMAVDLDVADANITNVNQLDVNSITVNDTAFSGFSTQYLVRLAALNCDTGDIITHDSNGDPTCLEPGTNGEVLKTTSSTSIDWEEDTDTDTVGVTIQEDGVTVAENVTTVNFLYAPAVAVTTPASNQADVDLATVAGAFWEDTTQANSNIIINTTNVSPHGNSSFVTRVDLTAVGGTIPTTDNEYYIIAEASSYIENQFDGSPLGGTFDFSVRFYDNTGTSTPTTGNLLTIPSGENGAQSDSSHVLQTVFCGLPADTKYIDVGWATVPTVPAAAGDAAWSDRYRGLITSNLRDSFTSPNGIGYPGGSNPTVTPDPNP